jgi:hypothetical protein
MKIYDCFTIYNEYELLELRLQLLYEHVDKFVIVEANKTFQNKPKDLLISKKMDTGWLEEYKDKIELIQVTDMPEEGDAWAREAHQRNSIMQGLSDAKIDDMIIISDVDEIPRPSTIEAIKNKDNSYDVYAFYMPLFNFKWNYMRIDDGKNQCWGQAIRRAFLDELTPEFVRQNRFYCHNWPNATHILHAGWHWSWLGGDDTAIDKVTSFSHEECNQPDLVAQINVEESIKQGLSWNRNVADKFAAVKIDDYFPEQIKPDSKLAVSTDEDCKTVRDYL